MNVWFPTILPPVYGYPFAFSSTQTIPDFRIPILSRQNLPTIGDDEKTDSGTAPTFPFPQLPTLPRLPGLQVPKLGLPQSEEEEPLPGNFTGWASMIPEFWKGFLEKVGQNLILTTIGVALLIIGGILLFSEQLPTREELVTALKAIK
jgi:hypothetical protein